MAISQRAGGENERRKRSGSLNPFGDGGVVLEAGKLLQRVVGAISDIS
jgi:hypothetical protein